MLIYNIRVPVTSLSVGAGTATTTYFLLATGTAIPAKSFLVVELDFEGSLQSSGYAELGLYRAATAYTAGSAVTPVSIDQPVTATAAATSASSAPTAGTYTTANPVHNFAINANGQRYFWRANPNLNNAIVVTAGTSPANQLVLATTASPLQGTVSISGRIQIAEL